MIEKSTFDYLKTLSRNNNREWFNDHRENYLEAKANVEAFVDSLIHAMNGHDQLEPVSGKKSLYRIYNDVRFSEDKTPYNPRFAGHLRRQKPFLRGGYYYWIKPGATRVGCGFTYPNPDDLKRIRMDILHNYKDWNRILRLKSITSTFGSMLGEQVRTTPKGFPKDHPAIGLLRYKQYWFEHSFSDKEALAKDFVKNVNNTFKGIRPFFNYMSEVLTTDLNGERII